MSKVACIIPTRGIIFAETVKGILSNYHLLSSFHVVSGRPMPDCFNLGVKSALKTDCTHILFVEEDNELPPGIVDVMLSYKKPIVTLDYPVGKGVSQVHRDREGKPLWCGLGCTLIERTVFESVSQPWFACDWQYNINERRWIQLKESEVSKSWGGHDVYFFFKNASNFPITVVKGMTGKHYRAKELQKRELNDGSYTIYSLGKEHHV